jgi:type III pantothenate kinase
VLLAIDSGNTNIVFAVFNDEGEIKGEWRAASDVNRTADEFGVWLAQLMERDTLTRDDITAAIIATVVPANLIHLQNLCQRYFDCEPLVVGEPSVELGLKILIDNPKEVGADRLCNAVSAHENYNRPVTIIDFGTATSFDVVDAEGSYRGGIISPGINLSLEALHMGAAQLPRVAIERPEKVVGTGTVTAMQSGIFWGYVSMIEGMTARIKEEVGGDMKIIATGGLASMFADATDAIDNWEQDLTLRGLLAIYRRNQS